MTKKYEKTKLVKRIRSALCNNDIVYYCPGYINRKDELVKCDKFKFEGEWYSINVFPTILGYNNLSGLLCASCALQTKNIAEMDLTDLLKED